MTAFHSLSRFARLDTSFSPPAGATCARPEQAELLPLPRLWVPRYLDPLRDQRRGNNRPLLWHL